MPRRRNGRQWVAIMGIALANMLFLALAGIWLSGLPYSTSAQLNTASVVNAPEVALSLIEIKQQLGSVEQQLKNLQASIDMERQVVVADEFDIDKQLQQALSNYKNTTDTAPVTDETDATKDWYVNLGSFSSREAALKIQQQIQTVGYQASITSETKARKQTFIVVLAGLNDRESAERVAKQIMEQTNLSSIWVSGGR